jgi:copper transport protein
VVATLLAVLFALPRPAYAHVRLDASTPTRDAVLTATPPRLQLHFTAHIEQRYTQLELTGPDQKLVPLGTITFVAGSDREFFADVPPLATPGVYTVRWRTAGADGHPLEGTFAFTLDVPPVITVDTSDVHAGHMDGDTLGIHGRHQATSDAAGLSASPLQSLGRGLHFIALTLLLGTLGFRLLLLPRLRLESAVALDVRRRVWRTAAFAVLALVSAVVVRLWLESAALHGTERALDRGLLSFMLTGTSWGRVWIVQAWLLGLFAAAVAAARPARDRFALFIAVPAALGLAAIPALSGHAADTTGSGILVVINDTLHVAAAGAWLGTLAMIGVAAVPALTRADTAPERPIADMIERFSPLALTAAAVLILSGVVNSLLHFGSLGQLVSTAYGRTLLIKLALVIGVLATGAYNWRRLRPRLGGAGSVPWLRRNIVLELTFALAVFAATAYLTGLPRPG